MNSCRRRSTNSRIISVAARAEVGQWMSRVSRRTDIRAAIGTRLRVAGRPAQHGIVGDHSDRTRRSDQRVDPRMNDDHAHLTQRTACSCKPKLIGALERQRPDREDSPSAGVEVGVDFVSCHPWQCRNLERLMDTLELVGEACRAEAVLCLIEDLVANVNDLAASDTSCDQSPPRRVSSRSV